MSKHMYEATTPNNKPRPNNTNTSQDQEQRLRKLVEVSKQQTEQIRKLTTHVNELESRNSRMLSELKWARTQIERLSATVNQMKGDPYASGGQNY